MFGISSTEFLLILVICFILVGPKRMAELAYHAGKWLGKLKSEIKYIKETQMQDFDASVFYDPKMAMNKTLDELKKSVATTDSEKQISQDDSKTKTPETQV